MGDWGGSGCRVSARRGRRSGMLDNPICQTGCVSGEIVPLLVTKIPQPETEQ